MLFHSFGDFTITLKYENADNKEWVSVSKLLNGTVYQSGDTIIVPWYHHSIFEKVMKTWDKVILPARPTSPSVNKDSKSLVFSCIVTNDLWLHVRWTRLINEERRNNLPHIGELEDNKVSDCKFHISYK